MFGVKQVFVILIWALSFAFIMPALAQENEQNQGGQLNDVQASDHKGSKADSEPGFSFEMPPEYQTDLPQDKAEVPKPIKKKRDGFDWMFLGPIFQILFYGLLALAVLYILYLVINSILVSRRSQVKNDQVEDEPDIPAYQPDAETARVLLDDADGLAAQGKFAEAVHILLFRSIQDIEDKRPHHVKRSLTSREIAGLSFLSPKARDVFSQIGRLVENSFFGGRALGAEDYEVSKAAYKAFAFENVATAKAARSGR